MRIRLLHVPPGSRRVSEVLFRRALSAVGGPDYSGVLHIVSSGNVAEERARAFQRAVSPSSGAYIPPEITTIRRLSRRLCSLYSNEVLLPGGLAAVVLSAITGKGMGLSTVVSKFISEAKQNLLSEDMAAFESRLRLTFEGLDLSSAVFERAQSALNAFGEYESLMKSFGAIDEDDAALLAPRIIKERLSYEFLIIDGLYEATPTEREVLLSLIGRARETAIAVPSGGASAQVAEEFVNFLKENLDIDEEHLTPERASTAETYHPFPSVEEEVEAIARHIKSAFISGRFRDLGGVVVAFPNIETYRDTAERVFKRYGVPAAIERRPLSCERPYFDILLMLESIAEDYPRLAFSGFLLSPYFGSIPETLRDAVPKACLSAGIIKGKDHWLRALRPDKDAQTALKKIFKRFEPIERLKGRADYGAYLRAIYETLGLLGFSLNPPDEGGSSEVKEHLKGLSLIDGVVGKKTDLRGFADSLRHMLGGAAGRDKGEGVRVMGLRAAMGLEPDFIYLGGLRDGDMPSMPDIDHLLPESVRARLGLGDLKRHLEREEFVFDRLRLSARGVYLTYPTMDGDKFYLPTLFLRGLSEKKDRVAGALSPEEGLIAEGKAKGLPLSSGIKEIEGMKTAGRKYAKGRYIRVTDIDGYRRCPRRFFIEKILGLEPTEAKEDELEAKTIGSALHAAMERLMPFDCEDADALAERASAALDEALRKIELDDYWKAFLKGAFIGILPELCAIEENMAKEGYSFLSAERAVRGEPIAGIRLKGKIDRIDAKAGGALELIDYKTGSADLSATRILEKGASLQLLLYAAILKTAGDRPERVGIYSLKDAEVKWIPNKSDAKKGRTLDDYIIASLRFLEETAGKVRRGEFAAEPIDEAVCRLCHERPYCPYVQSTDKESGKLEDEKVS